MSRIERRRVNAQAEGGAAYRKRRAEILAAAATVFKEKGLQGARIGDVADALGTDRASLYYYVGNLQELFNEVVREAADNNAVAAEAIRDGEGTPSDKVGRLVRMLMNSYAENYPLLYVYIQEDLRKLDEGKTWTKEMFAISRRYNQAVMGMIQQGVDDGTFRRDLEVQTCAYGIIGMVNWTHRWFDPSKPRQDAVAIGEQLSELAVRGLLA